jgi:predicted transcriptional regulator
LNLLRASLGHRKQLLVDEEQVVPEEQNHSLRDLVAEVAAAYFANSHVSVAEIGTAIDQIAKSLSLVGETAAPTTPPEEEAAQSRKLTSAQIRRSITPAALISFEDGKTYKTLRRHLAVKGLTPDQYREKWGLPNDYPIVSANYSAERSRMAKELGLGARGRAAPPARTRTRRTPAPSAAQ